MDEIIKLGRTGLWNSWGAKHRLFEYSICSIQVDFLAASGAFIMSLNLWVKIHQHNCITIRILGGLFEILQPLSKLTKSHDEPSNHLFCKSHLNMCMRQCEFKDIKLCKVKIKLIALG